MYRLVLFILLLTQIVSVCFGEVNPTFANSNPTSCTGGTCNNVDFSAATPSALNEEAKTYGLTVDQLTAVIKFIKKLSDPSTDPIRTDNFESVVELCKEFGQNSNVIQKIDPSLINPSYRHRKAALYYLIQVIKTAESSGERYGLIVSIHCQILLVFYAIF